MKVAVVRDILEANARIAKENRQIFDQNGVVVVNLMSGPGAGKTTLLERTIEALRDRIRIGVVEGDIQTSRDAERIAGKGVPVAQINTNGACHLNGNMVRAALDTFDLGGLDLLVVENVGNLVCPAEFDIGEDFKVMILSVAEGADKPSKYPLMFQKSAVLLINKIDLLPYVDCEMEELRRDARAINPRLKVIEVSCKTGVGMREWYDWLGDQVLRRRCEFRKLLDAELPV